MARDFGLHEHRLLGRLVDAGWTASCVYDIGSSNTSWSSMMRTRLPDAEFHLFDPLAAEYGDRFPSFEQSREAAIPAGIAETLTRISEFTLHSVALGDTNGECEMLVDKTGFSSMLSSAPGKPAWWTKRSAVPMRRLDDLVEERGLPLPVLMKMDTQGGELRILRGAERSLERCELLLLETWLERQYGPETPLLTELAEWLAPRGFVLFDLGHRFWDPKTHRLYAIDAYFARPSLLERFGDAARSPAD